VFRAFSSSAGSLLVDVIDAMQHTLGVGGLIRLTGAHEVADWLSHETEVTLLLGMLRGSSGQLDDIMLGL